MRKAQLGEGPRRTHRRGEGPRHSHRVPAIMAASSELRAGSRCLNPDVCVAPGHRRREAGSAFPSPEGVARAAPLPEVTVGQRGTGRSQPPLTPASPRLGACALCCWVCPACVRARACASVSLSQSSVQPAFTGSSLPLPGVAADSALCPCSSGGPHRRRSPGKGRWGRVRRCLEGMPGAEATQGFSFYFFSFRILQSTVSRVSASGVRRTAWCLDIFTT